MEMIESIILAAVLGSIVAVLLRFTVIYQKGVSAEMTQRMLEAWSGSRYPEFASFSERVKANKLLPEDIEYFGVYLDHLEEIAIMWHEGVITDYHMKEMFNPFITNTMRCKPLFEHLKKRRVGATYERIWEYIEKCK